MEAVCKNGVIEINDILREKLLALKLNQALDAFEKWAYFNDMKISQSDTHTLHWFRRMCERIMSVYELYSGIKRTTTKSQIRYLNGFKIFCLVSAPTWKELARIQEMMQYYGRFSLTRRDSDKLQAIQTAVSKIAKYQDTYGSLEGLSSILPAKPQGEDLPF